MVTLLRSVTSFLGILGIVCTRSTAIAAPSSTTRAVAFGFPQAQEPQCWMLVSQQRKMMTMMAFHRLRIIRALPSPIIHLSTASSGVWSSMSHFSSRSCDASDGVADDESCTSPPIQKPSPSPSPGPSPGQQPITGYHLDELGDWVAELRCGHFQHVRHKPPMTERPWVLTAQGRNSFLGYPLTCLKCQRGAPRDDDGENDDGEKDCENDGGHDDSN